jgi:2-polyprenyl-3-methyl-5-hydroxy-6-metoxy-1,4-benzoquinol methylase
MSGVDAIGRRVQAAYAGRARAERLHVAGRLRSCPIDVVAAATPAGGDILDFGCGHGVVSLYLAMTSPPRQVTGVDVDDEKVLDARAAAKSANVDITFEAVAPDYRPSGQWNGIVIVDVLYLLGRRAALELLDAAAGALVAGGVLVVKEVDTRPRWKYWIAAAQEFLATKVLRITEGTQVEFVPAAVFADRLRAGGLQVEHRPCDRGRLHPHHLIVATKAGS